MPFKKTIQKHWRYAIVSLALVASLTGLTGATSGRFMLIPGIGIASNLDHANAQSISSPLAAGDENWDDRFNTLGIDGTVRAITTSGSDVYVAGDFNTAGG